MDNRQAYNLWAEQYDSNKNFTRDLEGKSLRETLSKITFEKVLEVGCGTGKNSEWFVAKAKHVTAVDFSEEMLSKAHAKVIAKNINFVKADITSEWSFIDDLYNLVTFSLVLEHIEDISFIFQQVNKKIAPGGHVYIGELHPFKQYSGSLARFEIGDKRVELRCFIHHISDFLTAAYDNGFSLVKLNEWFDEDDRSAVPRILTLLLKKA